MTPLPKTLPLPTVLAGALLWVALVALADFATGTEIRIFPLYFLPVAFASWYARAVWGLLLALVSGLAWMTSNLLAGKVYSSFLIWGFNATTQFVAFSTVALLIAELRRRLALEEELSRTDGLTGLLNRRAFYERAGIEIARARRQGSPTAIVGLDLDNFKTVNDLHGHERGDEVLREVAALLRSETRTSDLVARLGGDEFVFLLPETDHDAAERLLERLCTRIAGAMAERRLAVTASFGAVVFPRAPEGLEAGIARADELLYLAKGEGKSRVRIESAPSDPGPAPLRPATSS